MARPKKILVDQAEMPVQPATERETAPVIEAAPAEHVWMPPPPPQAHQKRIERQGSRSEPYVRHYKQVRGGVCEYCGVIDQTVPSQFQYRLCEHYRGLELKCSYCPDNKDPDEVNYRAVLNIYDSPNDPGALIVVCDSYNCQNAHQKRFQLSVA